MVAALSLLVSTVLAADLPPNAATSTKGMVASVHPLATDAGVAALRKGGNAIDAAIAVGLTLGVVDAHNSGLGGGCFILIRLADGKLIAIGASPERGQRGLSGVILHTPGHTEGSVCLYLPDNSLLLAGDTLFAGSVGRTDLPGGNTGKLLHSIHERLLTLPDEVTVIPGHGPRTSIGSERASNPFLQNP